MTYRKIDAPRGFLGRIRQYFKRVKAPTEDSKRAGQSNQDALKGLAAELMKLDAIHDGLRHTPHFGIVVPPSLGPISRLDYVQLQCKLLLELKESFPGNGLSRRKEICGLRLTGLEICQIWAIFASWGHLWGTFATERALVFQLYHRRQTNEFLSLLQPEERAAVGAQSTHTSMYHIHECLAMIRIARMDITEEKRQIFRAVWCLYVGRSPDVSELLRAFRFARKVAIAEIHFRSGISAVGELVPQYPSKEGGTARSLKPYIPHPAVTRFADRSGLLKYRSTSAFERLLDAVAKYEYETFFSSVQTATGVLAHLREFKAWWTRYGNDVGAGIDALFTKPNNWLPQKKADLHQFVRLPVTISENTWPADVRDWCVDGTPWAKANFYLTLVPRSPHALLDIFIPSKTRELPAAALAHILNLPSAWGWGQPGRLNETIVQRREEAAACLLTACVNSRLCTGFRLEVEPNGRAPVVKAYAWTAPGKKALREDIKKTEGYREQELLLLFTALTNSGLLKPNDKFLWLNGTGKIRDSDDNPQTDLDGCVLLAKQTQWSILIAECKHTKQRPSFGKQVERWNQLFCRTIIVMPKTGKGGKNGAIVIAEVVGDKLNN